MFDYTRPAAAQALSIVERLRTAGFTAYWAGGCVRDGLLGRQPKDFDVATDATPDVVRRLLGRDRTLEIGAAFGVIAIPTPGGGLTEIATFRSDGTYSDGRHPDDVRFGSAEEDAQRRDYTINGLFYDPLAAQVIDFVGGQDDIRQSIVRAIGDPLHRLQEDKLRMLRGVRFAAALQFQLDPATAQAIRLMADQVTVTSGERIGAELRRMLAAPSAATALQLLADTDLLAPIWPGFPVNRDSISQAVDLARCTSPADFCGCVAAVISTLAPQPLEMLDRLREHWRLSIQETKAIEQAVLQWPVLADADSLAWSTVQPVLVRDHRDTILATATACVRSSGRSLSGVEFCQGRLRDWSNERLNPPPLISGQQLLEAGFPAGPPFKQALEAVRAAQLDGQIQTAEQAMVLAGEILEK